jgi:hypothetical protein
MDIHDPVALHTAAVRHLGNTVLMVLARFTTASEDSPTMAPEEIAHHVLGMLPEALAWVEEQGFVDPVLVMEEVEPDEEDDDG